MSLDIPQVNTRSMISKTKSCHVYQQPLCVSRKEPLAKNCVLMTEKIEFIKNRFIEVKERVSERRERVKFRRVKEGLLEK